MIQQTERSAEPDAFYAQEGEDRLLNAHFGGKRSGYFVEVGAYDGVELSNTLFFERRGWNGLLVEPDPENAAKCRQSRPRSTVCECAVVGPDAPPVVTFEVSEGDKIYSSLSMDAVQRDIVRRVTGDVRVRKIEVAARTLDAILEDVAPTAIDFMTIDVEGHEWEALEGLTLARWRPRVVILERNTLLPDRRILDWMHANGYTFGRRTGVNDWYFAATPSDARRLGYRAGFFVRYVAWPRVRAAIKPLALPVWRFLKARGRANG